MTWSPTSSRRWGNAYEASGIDALHLWPSILDVRQVELLAEGVLPAYR